MEEDFLHLCRDCLKISSTASLFRCSQCGSPRLVSNPELDQLTIAHVDCDSFYATIEKRDNPALMTKPVIVGGLGNRGVVSTACYIARSFGVRSAMPMFKARALCPHAVFLQPDMDKYRAVSRSLHAMMQELSPLVEALSIDEAFLDLSGTEKLHRKNAASVLAKLSLEVEKKLGITLSIGLSYNKFLAKIASDLEKPRGFSIISKRDALNFLASKPVSIIPGIGSVATARLKKAGFYQLSDIRQADDATLFKLLGQEAVRLKKMAWGEDLRSVSPHRKVKSISSETTLSSDLSQFNELEPILWTLCEKVSRRLKKSGLASRSVTLKLKSIKFHSLTRTQFCSPPTQLASRLFEISRILLKGECHNSTFYRLIGVTASDLCSEIEVSTKDLSDPDSERKAKVEEAVDLLRDKFGSNIVKKGISLRS